MSLFLVLFWNLQFVEANLFYPPLIRSLVQPLFLYKNSGITHLG